MESALLLKPLFVARGMSLINYKCGYTVTAHGGSNLTENSFSSTICDDSKQTCYAESCKNTPDLLSCNLVCAIAQYCQIKGL